MKYYAIGDLHGRYDLLMKAFKTIFDHTNGEDYKIITLGDYIDRGPQSKDIIETLIAEQNQLPLVCLQGNHEEMAVQSIALELKPSWWMGNGGGATMESYGHPFMHGRYYDGADVYYSVVPQEHVKWMNNLPLYYETEKQVFVHAGVHDKKAPLTEQQFDTRSDGARYMQWMLYHPSDHGGWRGKHVVHGHHQFADGPHKFLDPKGGGRTNLDTFAWKTGRLVVGVFDDSQLPAVDYLEIKDDTPDSNAGTPETLA